MNQIFTNETNKAVEMLVKQYLLDHAAFLRDLSIDNEKTGDLSEATNCLMLAQQCMDVIRSIQDLTVVN